MKTLRQTMKKRNENINKKKEKKFMEALRQTRKNGHKGTKKKKEKVHGNTKIYIENVQ